MMRTTNPTPFRPALALCLVACASLLTGCFSNPKPPTFKVVDVAVTDRSAEGLVVTITVEGTNPNPDPLPLDDVSYSLDLQGRPSLSTTRSAEAELPGFGTQRVRLPIAIPLGESAPEPNGQSDYRFSATMLYRVPGSIAEYFFDTGVRRPSVGFAESGTMDFSGAR